MILLREWMRYKVTTGMTVNNPLRCGQCGTTTLRPGKEGWSWRWRKLQGPKVERRCHFCSPPPNAPEGPLAAPRDVFGYGVPADQRSCPKPKCQGALFHVEPGYVLCANCHKRWPIQGAPIADQRAYELQSGLRQR